MSKSVSMDDFSLGAGRDAESEFTPGTPPYDEGPLTAPKPVSPKQAVTGTHTNEWQSVFNPGRNYNPNMQMGRSYYDTVDPHHRTPTTWEYILKSENMKQLSFAQLDKNADGVIDASDLRHALGPQANVDELIHQADKNGDGKIDYYEFCEMMKNNENM